MIFVTVLVLVFLAYAAVVFICSFWKHLLAMSFVALIICLILKITEVI